MPPLLNSTKLTVISTAKNRMPRNTIKSISAIAVAILNFLVLGVVILGSQGFGDSSDLLWYAVYWLLG